jgi:hypothetical protein
VTATDRPPLPARRLGQPLRELGRRVYTRQHRSATKRLSFAADGSAATTPTATATSAAGAERAADPDRLCEWCGGPLGPALDIRARDCSPQHRWAATEARARQAATTRPKQARPHRPPSGRLWWQKPVAVDARRLSPLSA